VLRRTQNIVFKDDFEPKAAVTPKSAPAAAPRFDRQYPDALRFEDEQAPDQKAERRGLDSLRAQAQRYTVINLDEGNPATPRLSPNGFLRPSRIIMLAVALVAAGVAAFLAMQLAPPAPAPVTEVVTQVVAAPTSQVLVAKQAMSIGRMLTPDAVEWVEWPEAAIRPEYVTAAATPEAITEMAGSVVRADIFPGEPILAQKLAPAGSGYLSAVLGEGMRGVSVSVAAASASGGFIVPNDRVDVVSTRTSDTGQVSQTILRNVRVLAINGKLAPSGDAASPDDPEAEVFANDALATLELGPTQAEVIINASMLGQLTLVLRSTADLTESDGSKNPATNEAIRILSPFWTR
jgi:pilus assembly protein CpaB